MRHFKLLFALLLFAAGSLGAQVAPVDTLDADVRWVDSKDSVLVAGAGLSQGVTLQTGAVVYVPIYYQGVEYRNRVARGMVTAAEDSTCRVKISAYTAPVRPGYRILLYGIRLPAVSLTEQPLSREKKPFYKRKWFWLAGGAAATAAIIVVTRGGSKSNSGKVVITGRLP